MKKQFTQTGNFEAYNAAVNYCLAQGWSVGSMSAPYPTGVLKQPGVLIAKWKNLTVAERVDLDGTISSLAKSFREGPIDLQIKD